jgi:hypothetical protein
MKALSCAEFNQMDMVDYLSKLGYTPQKICNHDYWYLSPFKKEKTASFKVNRKKNVWYDHAIGKGGRLVDFGILYHKCSIKEFLEKMQHEKGLIVSFHPQHFSVAGEKKKVSNQEGKIKVISSGDITDDTLKKYLGERKIPMTIAGQFCEQVCFELYNKKHLAIGFKNNSGGYELRNAYFKGSSTPKEPRLIRFPNANCLAVFEGFFSFLSFETLKQATAKTNNLLPERQTDFLILNSLSFFEKSKERMEKYPSIHLYLDRDNMGQKSTKEALKWSAKCCDKSKLYRHYKDLNDYLIKSVNPKLNESKRRGTHL